MKPYLSAIVRAVGLCILLLVCAHYVAKFRDKKAAQNAAIVAEIEALKIRDEQLSLSFEKLQKNRSKVSEYLAAWNMPVQRNEISRVVEGIETWAEQRGILILDRGQTSLDNFYYLGEKTNAVSLSRRFQSDSFIMLYNLLRFIEAEYPLCRTESVKLSHADGPLELSVTLVMTTIKPVEVATAPLEI